MKKKSRGFEKKLPVRTAAFTGMVQPAEGLGSLLKNMPFGYMKTGFSAIK